MRLVLCDDHALLLDALPPVLAKHGHAVVAAVTTPSAAVEEVRQHQPDVLVLDAYFPRDRGLRVVAEVSEASPTTRIVMLTAAADPDLLTAAIEAGVAGFALKGRGVDGILRTLDRVVQGEVVIDAELLRAAVERRHDPDLRDARWMVRFLTGREREVLDRLAAGESTREMAAAMGIARSTARTHVQNVLQKLGVHSRLQAAAALSGGRYPEDRPHPRSTSRHDASPYGI